MTRRNTRVKQRGRSCILHYCLIFPNCQFCTIRNVKSSIKVDVVEKVLETNPVIIVAVGDGEPKVFNAIIFIIVSKKK